MDKRRGLRERMAKGSGAANGGSTATGSSEEDVDGQRRRSAKCTVDFSRLDVATLRKYRRVNRLEDISNGTKEQLLPGIIQHFGSQDVDEQDILLAFAFALRKQRLSSMYVADAPPPKRTRGGRPRSAK
eukprot:jgi/Pico_ML_1/53064/g3679.t1